MEAQSTVYGAQRSLSDTHNQPFKKAAGTCKLSTSIKLSVAVAVMLIASGCSTNNHVVSLEQLRLDADSEIRTGHYNRAINLSAAACGIAKARSVSDNELALGYLTLGTAQFDAAQYSDAETSLLTALSFCKPTSSYSSWLKPLFDLIPVVKNEELRSLTAVNNMLAQVYLAESKFAQAKDCSEQALRTGRELYIKTNLRSDKNSDTKDITWSRRSHILYADVLTTAAEIARLTADFRQCRSLCREATEIVESLRDQSNSDCVDAFCRLLTEETREELDCGRYAEAEKFSRQALAQSTGAHGGYHPITFSSANTLAAVLVTDKRYSEAVDLLARYQPRESNGLRGHPIHCRTMLLNAIALSVKRHSNSALDEAFKFLVKADAITFGDSSLPMADDLEGFAFYQAESGDTTTAEDMLQHAQRIEQSLLGEAHPRLVPNLNSLACLALAPNSPYGLAEAKDTAQKAIEICENNNLRNTPEWQQAVNTLGVISVRSNDNEGAANAFHKLAVAEFCGAPITGDMVCGLKNYASLLRHLGKDSEAAQMSARVQQLEADTGTAQAGEPYRQVGYMVMPGNL